MSGEFKGARLKVRWAEKHIGKLKRLIDDFRAAEGHRIVTEYKALVDLTEMDFQSNEKVPDDINLAFGDAVHCLRVAFDYALFSTVKALNPTAIDKEIQFGVHADRVGANGVLTNTKSPMGVAFSTQLGIKVKEAILDHIYPNGTLEGAFSDLHKLDLIDKHRLLITCVYLGGADVEEISFGPGTFPIKNFKMIYQHGPNTKILSAKGNKVKAKMKPHVEIITNEVDLSKNDAVLVSLSKFEKFISETINAMERTVVSHGGFSP